MPISESDSDVGMLVADPADVYPLQAVELAMREIGVVSMTPGPHAA